MWAGHFLEDQFAWILLTTCKDHKGCCWLKMWAVQKRRRYHVALAARVHGGWPVERSKTGNSCGASPPPSPPPAAAATTPTTPPAGAAQQNRKQAGSYSRCCNALQWSVLLMAVEGAWTRLHELVSLCHKCAAVVRLRVDSHYTARHGTTRHDTTRHDRNQRAFTCTGS